MDNFVFCNNCGLRQPAGARFCARCGSMLMQPQGQYPPQPVQPQSAALQGQYGAPSQPQYAPAPQAQHATAQPQYAPAPQVQTMQPQPQYAPAPQAQPVYPQPQYAPPQPQYAPPQPQYAPAMQQRPVTQPRYNAPQPQINYAPKPVQQQSIGQMGAIATAKSWKCNYMTDEMMQSRIGSASWGGRLYASETEVWFEPNSLNRKLAAFGRKFNGRNDLEWRLSTDELICAVRKRVLLGSYVGIQTTQNETFWIYTWGHNDEIEALINSMAPEVN